MLSVVEGCLFVVLHFALRVYLGGGELDNEVFSEL